MTYYSPSKFLDALLSEMEAGMKRRTVDTVMEEVTRREACASRREARASRRASLVLSAIPKAPAKRRRRQSPRVSVVPGLRPIRISQGITQNDLTRLLGVSAGTISHWERGRNAPSIPQLLRVAEVLNCSLDELVFFRGDEPLVAYRRRDGSPR